MLRRVRISASVFLLFVAAVLGGAWIRSYSWVTNYQGVWGESRAVHCTSKVGSIFLHTFRIETPADDANWSRVFHEYHKSEPRFQTWVPTPSPLVAAPPTFEFGKNLFGLPGWVARFPFWFVVLVLVLLAAALGLRKPQRFSLRTFFAAVTLLALLLGTVLVVSRLPGKRPLRLPEPDEVNFQEWFPTA